MPPLPSSLGKLIPNFHNPLSSIVIPIAYASTFANNRSQQVSASKMEEARKTAIAITQEFDEHPANNHPFFTFLQEEVKTGLTPAQYYTWASNFAYRTIGTVKTVAQVISRAIENYDLETASKTGKNLFEETGSGNLEDMHLKLLAYTLNTHGDRVFGLPNFDILKIDPTLLLPATINFRKSQNKALTPSANYEELLGRLTAHEGAADNMLINFRPIFDSLKGYYTEDEFKKVIKYFDEHRDNSKEGGDVEAQHKEAALDVVTKIIATKPKADLRILRGGTAFLESQEILWTGFLSEMTRNRKSGLPVPPKTDFIKENPKTTSSKTSLSPDKESEDKLTPETVINPITSSAKPLSAASIDKDKTNIENAKSR